MPTPSFLIIADRGCLKAFSVDKTAERGSVPRLVETFKFPDAHGRFQDKVTDQAGGFPNGGSAGQGNSIAEEQNFESEMDLRVLRQVAERITSVLREHQPDAWSFAAPAEINRALVEGLDKDLQEKLHGNLQKDLIHTEPSELLARFE
jgi:hypothetical protein